MKKQFLIIPAMLIAMLVIAGCQPSATPEENLDETPGEETEETTKPEPENTIIIEQLYPDGTSEEIARLEKYPDPEPGESPQEGEEAIAVPGLKGMLITADGVQPTELTFAPGTKVIFENQDDKNHWIASDPHPTHTDCPGFDSGGAIKPGETYEFTFEEVGECSFHDHLDPGNTAFQGKITVQ